MRRDEIVEKLRRAEPALRKSGVKALYLFGSVARDQARSSSDIDVFVEPRSEEDFGFLQYMDAYETIRRAIGTEAQIGYSTREGLSRYIRAGVERETPSGSFDGANEESETPTFSHSRRDRRSD